MNSLIELPTEYYLTTGTECAGAGVGTALVAGEVEMAGRTAEIKLDKLEDKLKDPKFMAEFEANPEKALKDGKVLVGRDDPEVYRRAINALGVAVVVAVSGSIVLAAGGRDVPAIVTGLGSAAVGALAGLLAPQADTKRADDAG
jgi:hypothetical protein